MTASTPPPPIRTAPAKDPPTTAVRRRRPWVAGLAVATLAVAAVWLWILPPAVEAHLLSRLRHLGFREVRIGSMEVGLGHVTVCNLVLGSEEHGTGALAIAAATAQFTWIDLFGQRIDTLVLDEPLWTMSAMPGRAWSPIDDLLRHGSIRAPSMSALPLPELPMRHCILRGGRIAPPPGSGAEAVMVEATLTASAAGWDIEAKVATGTLTVSAVARLLATPQYAAGPVELRLLGTRPVEIEGRVRCGLEPEGRVLTLEMRRRPAPFDIALGESSWSGHGNLMLHANVPFAHLDAATLGLRLANFHLESTIGLQVSGLGTDVQLRGLPMPVTTRPQHVQWQAMRFAALEAGSGEATFELHSGPELRVQGRQRASDEIGSIAIDEVRMAPGTRSLPPTSVTLDQVSLQEWLELLSGGRVTGEGRLSGSVTLAVHTEPRLSIDLRGGLLTATPGGVVRFLDDAETEGRIRQHVQRIAVVTGHDAVEQDRLVAALREFGYTALEFRIEPDAVGDGVTLRVHAAGEGRNVPQQLDLDVNLHGFDTAVDTALAIKLGLDRSKQWISHKNDNQPQSPPTPKEP